MRMRALKDADVAPSHLEFVGMAGYAHTSFHDLIDDEVESDGSCIGDVMSPGHPLSRSAQWQMPWDSYRR